MMTRRIMTSSQRQTQNKMKRIIESANNVNGIELLLNNLKNLFEGKIINEIKSDDDVYTLELATLFNKMDLLKIKEFFSNDITLEIATNKKIRKTIISFWNNAEKEIRI